MKFQIIVPPIRKTCSAVPPYGALYVLQALKKQGHEVSLINVDLERLSTVEVFDRIDRFAPDVVGFTSIVATSYKFIKSLSLKIKNRYPEKKIVLGGHLSSAWEVVLNHTGVDIVVIGEGEVAVVELFNAMEDDRSLEEAPSLAYKDNADIKVNHLAQPIKNLDDLDYPLFDAIDIGSYLFDATEGEHHIRDFSWHRDFKSIYSKYPNVFSVVFTRGCVNRCTFCHRHLKGFRTPSVSYILDYLQYLQEKYKVGFFYCSNELTATNVRTHLRYTEEIKKRREQGFKFLFSVGGVIVNSVNEEVMKSYREAGAVRMLPGYESGSQKILDVMEKKTTVEMNLEVARLAQKHNMHTAGSIVIGMPGESVYTLLDNVDFLERAGIKPEFTSVAYAQALPGSAIYEYAKLKGFIVDEDKYLESVSDIDAGSAAHYLNYTDASLLEVLQWGRFVLTVLKYRGLKRKRGQLPAFIYLGYLSARSILPQRAAIKVFLNSFKTKDDFLRMFISLFSGLFLTKLLITNGLKGNLELALSPRATERGLSLWQTIKKLKDSPVDKTK